MQYPVGRTAEGVMPPEGTEVQVRPGAEEDLQALTDLYDHYAGETAITFDTAPFTPVERRPRLLSHPVDGPYRLMVATGVDSDTGPGPGPGPRDEPETGVGPESGSEAGSGYGSESESESGAHTG